MDGADEGVVIVSFGSYVLNLPEDISEKVLQVLLQLPMKSVFRSNLTSPDPAKILTSPWLPQNDLMGHPNTKVFVSHCGKNGQYEALCPSWPCRCSVTSLTTPSGYGGRGLLRYWTSTPVPLTS